MNDVVKYFWLRQELKKLFCLSVCPCEASLSKTLNLYVSLSLSLS